MNSSVQSEHSFCRTKWSQMIKYNLLNAIFGLFLTVTFVNSVEKFQSEENGMLQIKFKLPFFCNWMKSKFTASDPFECDMRLTDEQIKMLYSPARNGLISTRYRWPNKTVPYTLPRDLSQPQKNQIELALRTMESISCVKFVERTDENDYVDVIVCTQIDFHWNLSNEIFSFFHSLVPVDAVAIRLLDACMENKPWACQMMKLIKVAFAWEQLCMNSYTVS